MSDRQIRGWHDACKTYELRADAAGIVYCATCGARDLLPHREAITKAAGDPKRLLKWERQFKREVKAGGRGSR
jgi:uncharacterized Zn finger protein (UPF0148 family)